MFGVAIFSYAVLAETFVLLILNDMKSKNANINKDKYLRLSKLGSELDLSFSSQLALSNKLIALDGIKKKLLVCGFKNALTDYYVIELDKVKSISVKKIYSGIKAGELSERRFEEFTKSIHLYFEYIDANDNVAIPFYEPGMDEFHDLARLETIVKNWQMLLSKIIGVRDKGVIKDKNPGRLQSLIV